MADADDKSTPSRSRQRRVHEPPVRWLVANMTRLFETFLDAPTVGKLKQAVSWFSGLSTRHLRNPNALALKQAQKNNPNLLKGLLSVCLVGGVSTSVGVSIVSIPAAAVGAIVSTIGDMRLLTSLNLASNDLGAKLATLLAAALNGKRFMTELNLAGNRLGLNKEHGNAADLSGVMEIANTIPTMRALTSLNVSKSALCGIDEWGHGTYDASGMIALADAIGKHQ